MIHTAEATDPHITRSYEPEQILQCLPEGPYTKTYQPSYPDTVALRNSLNELRAVEPVTTPRNIVHLRTVLGRIALGLDKRPVIITGACSAEIDTNASVETVAQRSLDELELVTLALGDVVYMRRDLYQRVKPRSSGMENGRPSYMGEAVNGKGLNERTPDPKRMVSTACYDMELERTRTALYGEHVPNAHEALLLPLELSNMYVDDYGKRYLLSGDLPWIGKRTNDENGDHVRLLSGIENAVGVKIGADSTAEHIEAIAQTLNPDDDPGKLVFMARIGSKDAEGRRTILAAIQKYAPYSLIMYDIHGSTETNQDGAKIRSVQGIVGQIHELSADCRAIGLKLHGLHLETTHDTARLECVHASDHTPTHPGAIDPQLNPDQLKEVLLASKEYLL